MDEQKIRIEWPQPFLTQEALERFEAAMRELAGPQATAAAYRGALARAACRMGWLAGVEEAGVGGLRPGLVRRLANEIGEWILEAQQIDPE